MHRCALSLAVASSFVSAEAAALDLELVLHGGGFAVSRPDDDLAPVGIAGGLTPLLRLSPRFAVGLLLEQQRLGWQARGASEYAESGSLFPDDHGAMHSTMLAGVGRVIIVNTPAVSPYVQVALGHQAFRSDPDHPDCNFETPFGVQLGAGFDLSLTAGARIGALVTAEPFPWALSCNDVGYEGKPPSPPYPGLAFAGQLAFTTVWAFKRQTR